jgi:uncharacterized protein YjbI with pentapeptide repeats
VSDQGDRDRRNVIARLERSSGYLLVAIVILTALSVWFMTDKDLNKYAFATIPLLGIVVVLGCLFAFPHASVWEARDFPLETKPQLVNDIRTMLVSTVVGALTLSTLYLTYQSTRAAADSADIAKDSADIAKRSLQSDQISGVGDLLGNGHKAVRAAGVHALRKLMQDGDFDHIEGYRLLAAHIREHSVWDDEKDKKDKRWSTMSDEQRKGAQASPLFGVGSLRKRAYDVQTALAALGERSKQGLRLPQNDRPYRADLRDADLQGAEFGFAQLQQALFSGAHLDYMDCRTARGHADFRNAEFRGTSLYGAWLTRADLSGALFNTPEEDDGSRRLHQITNLRNANLNDAVLVDTDFQGADLTGASLRHARLTKAKLNTPVHRETGRRIPPTTRLTRARLDGAILAAATLQAADLRGAWLVGAQLKGASFAEADLSGAHLEGVNLAGVDLRAADLSDAWLPGAQLTGANLAKANLAAAHLRGANLTGLDLQAADLREAWLPDARLAGTNLAKADLTGAHLEGTDLSGSRLDGAVLDGATYSETTRWPDGFSVPPNGLVDVATRPANAAPYASMRLR